MIGRPSILKTRNVPNKDNKHTGTRDVIPFKNPDLRPIPKILIFLPHSKPQTTPSPTSKQGMCAYARYARYATAYAGTQGTQRAHLEKKVRAYARTLGTLILRFFGVIFERIDFEVPC